MLEAFGAEIILTPGEKGTDGAIEKPGSVTTKILNAISCPTSSATSTILSLITKRQRWKFGSKPRGKLPI